MVPDIRMTFPTLDKFSLLIFIEFLYSQSDPMIYTYMITDHSSFTDYNSGPMIYAEIFTDLSSGMYINPCMFMRIFRDNPWNYRNIHTVQFMSYSVTQDSQKSRK